MERFYFDLVGVVHATDLVGHACANEEEAKDHGRFIAHRIGTEKPHIARSGNYISVCNKSRAEIYQAPILNTLAMAV